jgi:hypothetical protein
MILLDEQPPSAEEPGGSGNGARTTDALKPLGLVTVLVGSNPTPSAGVMSQDIEDTANPHKGRGVFFGQPAGLPVGW